MSDQLQFTLGPSTYIPTTDTQPFGQTGQFERDSTDQEIITELQTGEADVEESDRFIPSDPQQIEYKIYYNELRERALGELKMQYQIPYQQEQVNQEYNQIQQIEQLNQIKQIQQDQPIQQVEIEQIEQIETIGKYVESIELIQQIQIDIIKYNQGIEQIQQIQKNEQIQQIQTNEQIQQIQTNEQIQQIQTNEQINQLISEQESDKTQEEIKIQLKNNQIQISEIIQIINDEPNKPQKLTQELSELKIRNSKSETIQVIDEEDSEEIIIISSSRRVGCRKGAWEECSLSTTKVVSIRFLGTRRINLRGINSLKEVFGYLFFEKLRVGLQKQFKSNDIMQYIGVKLMMGFMRMTNLANYWQLDAVLSTQIRDAFDQKAFMVLDQIIEINAQTLRNEMVSVKQEEEGFSRGPISDEFLPLVSTKINKKLRAALLPSQELVLIRNQTLQGISSKVELYQLIERESFYIVSQFFWMTKEDSRTNLQEQLIKLLDPFVGLHHIVYVAPRLLEYTTVMQFYQKRVLVCTEVVGIPESDTPKQVLQNGMAFAMQSCPGVGYIFPSFASLQNLQGVLTAVSRHQLSQEKMGMLGPMEGNGSIAQIVFPIILEMMVNNTLSLCNRWTQKQGRIQLAQELLRQPLIPPCQLHEIEVPQKTSRSSISVQTIESHRFPLEKVLHCPIFDANARCVVCLYEGTLAKTQASCMGCCDTLQRKIYLCVYPCFRKFHLEPTAYVSAEEGSQVEGYYDEFQLEDEEEAIAAMKPERNSDLDMIYQIQHRDIEDELQQQQYGVPVNYEDDFRNKTKWVKVQKTRGSGATKGRRGGQAVNRGRQVNFTLPQQQGVQGGTETNSAPKRKGGRKKGQQVQQQQQVQNQQAGKEGNDGAMLDFFQMVRKKVMNNNNNNQGN